MSKWSDLKLNKLGLSGCDGCPLLHEPGPVWPRKKEKPLFHYIAEAPSWEELKLGDALVGPSGQTFNSLLGKCGISREEIHISNIVKCKTPGNREPTKHEMDHCQQYLNRELENAKVVVLAGKTSFNRFLGSYSTLHPRYRPKVSFLARTGCPEYKDGKIYLPTPHPAYIRRQSFRGLNISAQEDLTKALRLSRETYQLPDVKIYPSDEEVEEAVNAASVLGFFSDDVETRPPPGVKITIEEDDYIGLDDWKVDIAGFSYAPYKAMVCKPEQVRLWTKMLSNPNCYRFEHNGPYDQYYINKLNPARGAKLFDTMIAHHYLRSHMYKYLKPYVLRQYTTLPYYDRHLESISRPFYNGMDVVTTYLAGLQTLKELKQEGIYDIFYEIGMEMLPILDDVRRIGTKVDLKKALLYRKIFDYRIAESEKLLSKITGEFFNWNSPKQVKGLFYEHWKLPRQYNGSGKTRKLTTDFEARKRLRRWIEATPERQKKFKIAHIALNLQDYKKGEEKKKEFLDRVDYRSMRAHPFYKEHGQHFFRLSSVPNMQNIPVYSVADWGGARRDDSKKSGDLLGIQFGDEDPGSLRSMYIPDSDDHVFLTVDYSQMQLWIYAYLFDVKWLKQMYETGDYIYGIIYETMYGDKFFKEGLPRTKANKRDDIIEQRIRRAKAVPLGFLFGRTAEAVAKEYGWTLKEAEELRNGYWFKNNPELLESYKTIEYLMVQQGYIRHAFGQKIWYPNQKLSDAINSHAQGNEPFVLKRSIIHCTNEFKKRGLYPHDARLALTVHDSMTFSIRIPKVIECYEEIINPALTAPIPELNGLKLRHEANVETMWDWGGQAYHKWKEEYLAGSRGTGSTGSSDAEQLRKAEPGSSIV